MPTIRDVARACGLSAMTVSAVLNGRPGAASAQTRARVLRKVQEMGYHPNAVARGLTRRRMNTLGVVLAYDEKPSLTADRYLGPILDGLLTAGKRHHQRTLIITEDTWGDALENLPSYCDGHCDGLIFVIPNLPSAVLLDLKGRRMPFVLIGESRPEPGLCVVDLDNVGAGATATAHLAAQGHRKIAYLGGHRYLLSTHQRAEGYWQALAEAGLETRPEWMPPGVYEKQSGYERAHGLLDLPAHERPTALFCGDDWIALGALQALAERGARVPEEMSLVGINGDPEAEASAPPLTTVAQPFKALGADAVELVLAQIAGRSDLPEKVLLPGELIVRGSVASRPPSHVLEEAAECAD